MNKRLTELLAERERLANEWCTSPMACYSDDDCGSPAWKERQAKHDAAWKAWSKFERKNSREIDKLIIEENKKKGVYWDRLDWIYDAVKTIPQHYELTGQERTAKFVEDLEKIHGCVVTEEDAGFELEVFTPHKVYIYRFNRGYGNYPIRVTKGYIAPGGNTYLNKIFLAKSARDMKERYSQH